MKLKKFMMKLRSLYPLSDYYKRLDNTIYKKLE